MTTFRITPGLSNRSKAEWLSDWSAVRPLALHHSLFTGHTASSQPPFPADIPPPHPTSSSPSPTDSYSIPFTGSYSTEHGSGPRATHRAGSLCCYTIQCTLHGARRWYGSNRRRRDAYFNLSVCPSILDPIVT